MKKKFKLQDLDCAKCAVKMEDAIRRLPGVTDATVNFMTLKMKVEFEEGADEKKTMKEVLKACRKFEPDCEIEY